MSRSKNVAEIAVSIFRHHQVPTDIFPARHYIATGSNFSPQIATSRVKRSDRATSDISGQARIIVPAAQRGKAGIKMLRSFTRKNGHFSDELRPSPSKLAGVHEP